MSNVHNPPIFAVRARCCHGKLKKSGDFFFVSNSSKLRFLYFVFEWGARGEMLKFSHFFYLQQMYTRVIKFFHFSTCKMKRMGSHSPSAISSVRLSFLYTTTNCSCCSSSDFICLKHTQVLNISRKLSRKDKPLRKKWKCLAFEKKNIHIIFS